MVKYLFLLIFPLAIFSSEPVGKITALEGEVIAKSEGKDRALQKDSKIFVKETIVVSSGALAQILFTDGSLLDLISDTEFRIDSYRYKGFFRKDGSSSSLTKGGLRLLTGKIAKNPSNDYDVHTPWATIGLRGTQISAAIEDGKLYVGASSGRVIITNMGGSITIGPKEPNRYATISAVSIPPQPQSTPPPPIQRDRFPTARGGLSIDEVETKGDAAKEPSTPTDKSPTPVEKTTGEEEGQQPPEEEEKNLFEAGEESESGGASIQGGC